MDPSWVLSYPKEVAVSAGADGEVVLTGPRSRVVLRHLPPGLRDGLLRLAAPGEAAGRLAESIRASDGPDAQARWYYTLQNLLGRQCLHLSADAGGERLATLVPTAPGFVLPPSGRLSGRPCILSRFVCLRRNGDALVMESPLSGSRVVLLDPRAVALLHALSRPGGVADLAGSISGLPADAVAPLLGLLVAAGMACEVGDGGTAREDDDPALGSWEFHDLLFHARSRSGRHDAPVGATYRMAGRFDPPPALKQIRAAAWIDLYRPDLETLQRNDPPFARVLEQRRSFRHYAAEPITDRQLGEFLYRVARVKEVQEMEVATPAGPMRLEFTQRPYPAGGGLYELEVYAVVHACRGLAPGLYHYDPLGHRLGRLGEKNADVDRLLFDAAQSASLPPEGLQVLLILAARAPRLAWKYASLAYALILKHVGVVYQTMYLAATAMGLAPCALGGGDSEVFARAAGVDYYAESSVGEFLLGSVDHKREG